MMTDENFYSKNGKVWIDAMLPWVEYYDALGKLLEDDETVTIEVKNIFPTSVNFIGLPGYLPGMEIAIVYEKNKKGISMPVEMLAPMSAEDLVDVLRTLYKAFEKIIGEGNVFDFSSF